MKTTIDLGHLSTRPDRSTWPPLARRTWPAIIYNPTFRIGAIFSVVAVITAIVLNGVLEVPVMIIVMGVLAFGFVLSWRAAGRLTDD